MHKERLAFQEKLNKSKAEKAKAALAKVNSELGVGKKLAVPREISAANSNTSSATASVTDQKTIATTPTTWEKSAAQVQRNSASTIPKTSAVVERTLSSANAALKNARSDTPSAALSASTPLSASKSVPPGNTASTVSAKTTTSATQESSMDCKGAMKKYCPDCQISLPSLEAYNKHVQSIMHENKVAANKRPDRRYPGGGSDSRRSDSRANRYPDSRDSRYSDSRDNRHSDSRDSRPSDSRDSRHTDFIDSQGLGHSPSRGLTPTNVGSRILDNSGSRAPSNHGNAGSRAQNTAFMRRTGSPAIRNQPHGPSVPEDKQYCTACDISLPNHEAFMKHIGGILHQERVGAKSRMDKQKDFPKSSSSIQYLSRNFPGRYDTVENTGVAPGHRGGYPDKAPNHCALCDIHFHSRETYVKHTKGLMHLQKMKATEVTEAKPFTKISYEDFLDGGAKGDAGKKRKAEEDMKFFCKLCNTQLISGSTFKAHMERLHHRTGLLPTPGEDDRASEKVSRPSCLKTFVEQSTEALLGLKYVTEYQHPTHDTIPTFLCRLCDISCDYNNIKSHVVSYKHRIFYFKKHEPMIADDIKRLAGIKLGQVPNLEHFAKEVESKVGKGQVVVKIDEKLCNSEVSEPKKSRLNPAYDRYDSSSTADKARYTQHDDRSGVSKQGYDGYGERNISNKQRYDRHEGRAPAESQRYDPYDDRSTLDKQRYDPYFDRSTMDKQKYDPYDRSTLDKPKYDPYNRSTMDKPKYDPYDRSTLDQPKYDPYDRSNLDKSKYDPYDRSNLDKSKYDPYNRSTLDKPKCDPYDRSNLDKPKYDPYNRSTLDKSKYDPYDRSNLDKPKYDPYDRSTLDQPKYDPYNRSNLDKLKHDPYDRSNLDKPKYDPYDRSTMDKPKHDPYDRSNLDKPKHDPFDRSTLDKPKYDPTDDRAPVESHRYSRYDDRAQAEGQRVDHYDDRTTADRARYDTYGDRYSYNRKSPVSRTPHGDYDRREEGNKSQYSHYDDRAQYDDRQDLNSDRGWAHTDLRSSDPYTPSDRRGQDVSQISEKTLAIQKENELLAAILEAAKSSASKNVMGHSADRSPAAVGTGSPWAENSPHSSREARGGEAYDPFEPTSPGAESHSSLSKRDISVSRYSYSPNQQPAKDHYSYGQHAQHSRPGLFGQMDRDQRSSYDTQGQGQGYQDQQQHYSSSSGHKQSSVQYYNALPHQQTDRDRGHYYDDRGHQQGHYDQQQQYNTRGYQQTEHGQQQQHYDTHRQQHVSYHSPMSYYQHGTPPTYQGSSHPAGGNGGQGPMMSNMLSTVSGCMVSNEEDAAVALQVSSTLTQALLQYKIQSSSGEGKPCIPDLATLKERMSKLHDQ
ncbi:uncharacterized protein LOC135477585 [Liolophura sinensis]|uniref:uncharacterized protein LOC135477585 n=1 Tax=Liolophura sinensis TaxID=3198878 RepID=UPI0031581D79